MEFELIELVRANPSLYDVSLPSHKDYQEKENTWSEIADKLNLTVSEARKKWLNLRSCYTRIKRPARNGFVNRTESKWVFYDAMTFLDPFIKSRVTSRNRMRPPYRSTTTTSLVEKPIIIHTKKDLDEDTVGSYENYLEDQVQVDHAYFGEPANCAEEVHASLPESPANIQWKRSRVDESEDSLSVALQETTKVFREFLDSAKDPNAIFLKGLLFHFSGLSHERQAALRRALMKTVIEFEEKKL